MNRLRQADVELGRGKPVAEVCRLLGVTEPTYYEYRAPAPETIAAGLPSAPLRAALQGLARAPGLAYTVD